MGKTWVVYLALSRIEDLPTHWFIWPFKGPLKGFKRLLKRLLKIFTGKFVPKIDRKLSEKQVKKVKQTSLKLFPSTPKFQRLKPHAADPVLKVCGFQVLGFYLCIRAAL